MDEFFARNRLSTYLDGELTTDETREVEEALARSPELRSELDQLRAAVALLRKGGPVPAPKDFARNLERRLSREPIAVGWTRHLRAIRPEVALLAAAAALVIVYVGRGPQGEADAAAVAEADAVAKADTDAAPTAGADRAPAEGAAGDADVDGALAGAPSGGQPALDVAGMPGLDAGDGAVDDDAARKRLKAEAAAAAAERTGATKTGASKRSGLVEKEAYAPAWEQAPQVATPPTVQAPARYRLTLTAETGLRDLDAIVRRYGGQLQDERGRPLAPYPMETGETRRVRLAVPASTVSAGQLYAELQALGHAELTQTDSLYLGSSPILVEVHRE